mgnify:CR=1 FL=1
MSHEYSSIEGLEPRLPLGAALCLGIKGPSGAPTQTDRFFFVSPYDSTEGKFSVRPQLASFRAFNEADVKDRQSIKGNLLHSRQEDCFYHHLRAQVLTPKEKWPAHPQKRPACVGDGHNATRYFGQTGTDDFRPIPCPGELCPFRQGASKACKPFLQLLFRPRWKEGSPLPTPLTKLTSGSWYSAAAILGFFTHVREQAAQLGIESFSLYGLPFVLSVHMKTKPQASQRFPVLSMSPDTDLIGFLLAQREQLDRIGGHAPLALPAVALTDAEMRSPEVLASDAALISGPVSKPANAPEIIEADEVQANPAVLSSEAVARILGIAKGKGISPDALGKMIGGKLEDAPPSAELEILRQIAVSK